MDPLLGPPFTNNGNGGDNFLDPFSLNVDNEATKSLNLKEMEAVCEIRIK